ncbi:S-layer homology domain-containing protein [Fusibacter sp. JL298sf-3]
MKKIITMLILLTMVIGAVPVYAAEGDTPSSWAKDFVEEAIEKGYVPAHLQGKYQQPITREEFAELFVTAVFAEINADYQKPGTGTKTYTGFGSEFDVDDFLGRVSTTESFTDTENKYVKVANILGMVNGIGGGKFNPDGLITREQAAIMFVNYLQTVWSPGGYDAYETLDDINEASSWARDAVAWAYGAGFINGTRQFTHANGKITSLGHFDTKGNFTREQAITVIAKLDKGDHLGNLILRGYVYVGIDGLGSYWEIDGDTIYMKSRGEDYKYSGAKQFLRTQTKFKHYAEEYTTEELIAVFVGVSGAVDKLMFDTYHHDKVLSGKETLYDYGVFTVQHNIGGYLAIVKKNPMYGYMGSAGSVVAVDSDRDGEADTIVTGVEVK